MELIVGAFLLVVVSLFGHIGLVVGSFFSALQGGSRGVSGSAHGTNEK